VKNLVDNAIRYTPAGGRIDIRVAEADGRVVLDVDDTGPGIPEEKRNLLFRPFERLGEESSEIEGTGIGLALSKGLVDAMGGSIGLENPDGGGCVFWVELPLASSEELQPSRVEPLSLNLVPAHAAATSDYTKILVIESHDFDLRLLEKLLQRML
jgi:signal transduction histidine kinase